MLSLLRADRKHNSNHNSNHFSNHNKRDASNHNSNHCSNHNKRAASGHNSCETTVQMWRISVMARKGGNANIAATQHRRHRA